MSLPATDNFNRADAANLGANWTDLTSYAGMQIVGNQAETPVPGYSFSYWNADAFSNDQYSKCIAKAGAPGGSQKGPIVRAVTGDKCYFFDFSTDSGNSFLFLLNAGAGFSTLASFGPVTAIGDLMEIRAIGSSISCFVNGVQVGSTVVNTTLASGSAGIGGARGATTNGDLDNWEGGNIVAGGIVRQMMMQNEN